MKVLFDTNVLIAAIVASHSHHLIAFPWLERVRRGEIQGVVSAHTISELYSYLTDVKRGNKLPVDAKLVIDTDVLSLMEVVGLTETEYVAMIDHAVTLHVRNGLIYDTIHATVALKVNADVLLTINRKDFYRLYPELIPKIVDPRDP